MAESLPRYHKAGVLLADIPRLDFGDRREVARSTALLDERLGQLSQWALGEAADRAQEEGLQYGAENPVTMQQLKDAEAVGQSPNDLLQSRRTVFGKSARQMQVAGLVSDVEMDAQEQILRLKLGVENGEIDLPTARNELNALVNGTGKSMVAIDPKASLKIRAALSTVARDSYMKMAASAVKKAGEADRVRIDDWISNAVPEMVRGMYDAGDTIDPETGKVVTPQQRITATLHSTLREKLAGQSDEFARQADKRFAEVISKARINAVTGHVIDSEFSKGDPTGALTQIRQGKLGKYEATWRAMPADEQEKVVVNFMQEIGRAHTLSERAEKDATQAQKKTIYDMLAQYWPMPDGKNKTALRDKIVKEGSGVIPLDSLKSLLKPKEGEGKENVNLEVAAIDLVRRGGVADLAEVQRRVPGLQPKQLKRLQDTIYDSGDRRLREVVRNLAGIPDGMVQLDGDQQRRYKRLTAEMERLKDEEISASAKAGRPGMYNPATVIAKLAEAKERVTQDKAVDAARAALQSYGKPNLDENTSEEELKKLKLQAGQIKEIQRQQKLIRDAR